MNPDEACGVCGTKRDEHGDKQHEFNLEGNLIPKKTPEPARQQAPQERGSQPTPTKGVEEVEKSHLRLIQVLIQKGLIDANDVLEVLGGIPPTRGSDTR